MNVKLWEQTTWLVLHGHVVKTLSPVPVARRAAHTYHLLAVALFLRSVGSLNHGRRLIARVDRTGGPVQHPDSVKQSSPSTRKATVKS